MSPKDAPSAMGLEAFQQAVENQHTQGPMGAPAPFFNPVNMSIKDGVYYVTIYACSLGDGSPRGTAFALWLASLKETDHVRLSVSSLLLGIPYTAIVGLLAAITNTPAKVEIMLDQIVNDVLAYFYLCIGAMKPPARSTGKQPPEQRDHLVTIQRQPNLPVDAA